jgi:hypothetical protein
MLSVDLGVVVSVEDIVPLPEVLPLAAEPEPGVAAPCAAGVPVVPMGVLP